MITINTISSTLSTYPAYASTAQNSSAQALVALGSALPTGSVL